MAHCNFEPKIQWDCVKEIVVMLRQGQIDRNKMLEIVEHAACFMGSGAALLRDEPNPVVGMAAKTEYTEQADQLAALVPGEEQEAALRGIPWLEVMKILLPIIIALLEEKE